MKMVTTAGQHIAQYILVSQWCAITVYRTAENGNKTSVTFIPVRRGARPWWPVPLLPRTAAPPWSVPGLAVDSPSPDSPFPERTHAANTNASQTSVRELGGWERRLLQDTQSWMTP